MSSLFRVLLVAIAVGLVLWGGTIITRVVIIENMAWSDVIPLHTGCQTVFKGQPPYDDVVTARIQSRLTVATENEQRFAYPAHMCLVLAPIWLLPYDIAAPLWTFLQLMLFAALPLLIFNHILHTPISPLRMAVLLLFSLLGYRYTMMTIVLGQYTGFTMWCLLGAAWALSQRRAGLAALLMATMTVRAEAAIFAGILALLALYRRQWRVVVLWLAIGLGLWLGATAAIGPWIGAFITRMGTYNSYTETQWLPLYLGPIGAVALTLAVAGWLVWSFRQIRGRADGPFWLWASAIVAAAGLILVPLTNVYTLVYVLPGLYMALHACRDCWQMWAAVLVLLALAWGFFLLGRAGAGYDQLFFPLALAGLVTLALRRKDSTSLLTE